MDCNDDGCRFNLYSAHAEAVELCLFDGEDERRVALDPAGGGEWSRHEPAVRPGQRYGFRVHGPWAPERGHRFDPSKLLIDPRARELAGGLTWRPELVEPPSADASDTAPWVPRSVVADHRFDWEGDRRPRTPWDDTVIYECHVRGMTRLHPEVPEALRGTYLGLAEPVVLDHLQSLGVTAVELMPVAAALPERHLAERQAVNYWGYSPIAFFAPEPRYATAGGDPLHEIKTMVRACHAAGLEVLVDVVFNHTAEGGRGGPTLSLRGIDNASYYRLEEGRPANYVDWTGTGNTLDLSSPAALRLVVDALRYWAEEVRVDGFRFDLATTLARDAGPFDPRSSFLDAVHEDPTLSRLKLIAEPWDLGPGGYRLGQFPAGWAEWNDRFRDGVRTFWRGDPGKLGELQRRLEGSSDLFADRAPTASINYVTSHDGFTLADLVSFERKRNLANGENNRDGSNHNSSANWGIEGPTSSELVNDRRARVAGSMLATLALSSGVPMLSHGDELGRTQGGNNNTYCQDNETSWVEWRLDLSARRRLELTRTLFALRREFPEMRSPLPAGEPDQWLLPSGHELTADAEHRTTERALARRTGRVLLLLNAGFRARRFHLPEPGAGKRWARVLDTSRRIKGRAAKTIRVPSHSVVLMISVDDSAG